MAEGVTFWLDNKNSSGTKVGQLGKQTLVNYRDRFYLVENGSALTRAGKPLRYSQSSLPALWKKVLRGEDIQVEQPDPSVENAAPSPVISSKTSAKKDKKVPPMPDPSPVGNSEQMQSLKPVQQFPMPPKATRKSTAKTGIQSYIPADCPYCSQKHEIPVEKGRNGKPFFIACSKCKAEFAVRFVQVVMYKAQVAAFR